MFSFKTSRFCDLQHKPPLNYMYIFVLFFFLVEIACFDLNDFHVRMKIYKCMHAYACACMHTCVCIHEWVFISMYMSVHAYMCMCMHMCVYVHFAILSPILKLASLALHPPHIKKLPTPMLHVFHREKVYF